MALKGAATPGSGPCPAGPGCWVAPWGECGAGGPRCTNTCRTACTQLVCATAPCCVPPTTTRSPRAARRSHNHARWVCAPALRAPASPDPAVVEVLGSPRYRIDGDASTPDATVHVIDSRGIAKTMRSRTGENPVLRGTKHLVANERLLMVAKGRSDDRTVVILPEVHNNRTIGLTLLHVRFHEHLDAQALRSVLGGYRNRYQALADAVTETEPTFDEELLAAMPVVDLLCDPIYSLADRWRQGTLHTK